MGNLLFAFMGDCGTPWPGWWKPKPEPQPWWWIVHVVAAGGGILGGNLVQGLVNGAASDPIVLLASMAGAFAVGRFAGGIAAGVLGAVGAGNRQQIATRAAG